VIPLDATLVKGSHGVRPARREEWPVLLTRQVGSLPAEPIESTAVQRVLRDHVLS
jgi:hypothetical protein